MNYIRSETFWKTYEIQCVVYLSAYIINNVSLKLYHLFSKAIFKNTKINLISSMLVAFCKHCMWLIKTIGFYRIFHGDVDVGLMTSDTLLAFYTTFPFMNNYANYHGKLSILCMLSFLSNPSLYSNTLWFSSSITLFKHSTIIKY